MSTNEWEDSLEDKYFEMDYESKDSYGLLAKLMAKSPAFREYVEKQQKAMNKMKSVGDCCPECKTGEEADRQKFLKTVKKAKDCVVSFSCEGKRGEEVQVSTGPLGFLFRGEKVMATDWSKKNGFGTKMILFVNGRAQASNGEFKTTYYRSDGSLGCGVKMDICEIDQSMMVKVKFSEDCKFNVSVFGKAAVRGDGPCPDMFEATVVSRKMMS